MNWGYKILSFYALFVVGILFMVFKSSSQNTDLVTTDYYAKELKYQDKIDEQNRVSALTAPINYKLSNDSLI
ncbi:MAG: FixH family protein, partial [Ferruginibacter sp.]